MAYHVLDNGGADQPRKRVTVRDLAKMKAQGRKIPTATAYDALTAAIADEAARATRLRQAGAWTIVLLTLAFFAAALLLAARLRQQLLVPVEDIADVLDAHAAGDPFRRCRTASLDDSDMRQLCERLNSLLDQSARHP